MHLPAIPFEKFLVQPHQMWHTQWLLLTSGDFASGQYNAMTVGWGSFGTMWGRPFAQVLVRPIRYTFEFIERYDTFTLCAFPQAYHEALSLLGTRSGRDSNKIAEAALTPTAAQCVAAPAYAEAELVIECRKVYWYDLDPAHFIDAAIDKHYPKKDYHRVYFGEMAALFGVDHYQS